ncbi:MAG TPA: malonyl-CoA synthase [Roseiarcus sp.]|nr:malonyl-CoA synthase [Roseiarcus sp.]
MSANIYELIRGRAPSLDKPAMVAGEHSLTFGQLFARSAQAANAMFEFGVQPGDRVAVQIDKSPDAIVLALAAFRAGAALLPLNTAYTLAELEYFLDDAKPTLTICRPVMLAAVRALADRLAVGKVHSLGVARDGDFAEAMLRAPSEFDTVPRASDDLAAILYTSGTTGRSKGAMLSHENLSSNALTLVEAWRFTPDDVLIHALPVFHTHGLFVATNVALLAGATMIFQPRFDADAIVAALPRATSLMGVPTFYVRLLAHEGVTRETTKRMRLFVSGSAPLLAETHEAWRVKTGHSILERYGMTETNMITSNPYDGDRIAGTVGFPLPGVLLRIADPQTGRALAQGEIGVIEVKGPNVFKGYWRMPEKTAEEFRPDGFFITGDLGEIDELGYVHIVGRAKDLIISGGFNVYPKEIEAEIDALPGVVESAVIGLPHPDFGEGVTAIVVPDAGAALEEADILAALEGRLAKYKLPKRVFFVSELPRNAMGKVQKKALREARSGVYGGG